MAIGPPPHIILPRLVGQISCPGSKERLIPARAVNTLQPGKVYCLLKLLSIHFAVQAGFAALGEGVASRQWVPLRKKNKSSTLYYYFVPIQISLAYRQYSVKLSAQILSVSYRSCPISR